MPNMLYAIVYLAGLSHPCLVTCRCFDQQDLCLSGQKHIFGCHGLFVAATMLLGPHVLLLLFAVLLFSVSRSCAIMCLS